MRTEKKLMLGIVVIGVIGLVFILKSSNSDLVNQETQTVEPVMKPDPVIEYSVLRKWLVPKDGLGMELLVSPTSSKEEVLRLAESLRNQFGTSGKFLWIMIYDDRIAWSNQLNEKFSQKEYLKHFLVTINVNPSTGYNEIEWQAEGRVH